MPNVDVPLVSPEAIPETAEGPTVAGRSLSCGRVETTGHGVSLHCVCKMEDWGERVAELDDAESGDDGDKREVVLNDFISPEYDKIW